jgi:hypothetical protein
MSGALILGFGMRFGFGFLKRHFKAQDVMQENVPADFQRGTAPEKELSDYRREMNRVLTTYGWVDRDHQIVRIPIEEAMKDLSHEK